MGWLTEVYLHVTNVSPRAVAPLFLFEFWSRECLGCKYNAASVRFLCLWTKGASSSLGSIGWPELLRAGRAVCLRWPVSSTTHIAMCYGNEAVDPLSCGLGCLDELIMIQSCAQSALFSNDWVKKTNTHTQPCVSSTLTLPACAHLILREIKSYLYKPNKHSLRAEGTHQVRSARSEIV